MGTTWAFDAPATPESQNTHMMILTQAQIQELEGTGDSTHQGTQPLTSPHKEARGSSAPAAQFVFDGGAARVQENGTHRDGHGGTNDTTQGKTSPREEAHTMEQEATDQTPTTDPVEPNPDEDTDTDGKL